MSIEYVLRRPDTGRLHAPALDASQQAVVDYPGGPLLVLAGPGTGKTTTLVEVVVDRIENRGYSPDQILVLTFSRKAADELRSRISRRLGRTVKSSPAMTFHSFCYGLVREFSDIETFLTPVTLMSAPEQDAVIAELLAGHDASEWPKSLQPALRTRGFAAELHDLMAAASSHDLGADDVASLARKLGRSDWERAAEFFDEYAQVTALQNKSDYTDIVMQAARMLRDPEVLKQLRDRYRLVIVDEYQDTDPLQVQLLRELAGGGRDLIAVGDPDQAIYAFRGADVKGILQFRQDFSTLRGPAPMKALASTRRFGPNILAVSRAVISKVGFTGGLDRAEFEAFRGIQSRAATDGSVTIETYATAAAEAESIALGLRRAHLERGVPWSDMAVLVRSGSEVARLERAFGAAGVPVEVAGDEVPLAMEPAVRTLLAALHIAADLAAGRPITGDQADALLTGPLGGFDAPMLRRLGRALRRADAERPGGPRSSAVLIAEALAHPLELLAEQRTDPGTADALNRARRVAHLLAAAAQQIASNDSPEDVVWTLWDGTSWPARLRAEAESSGEGALQAAHDLDAVVALFRQAAWSEEQRQHRTIGNFVAELQAQQIPGESLSDVGTTGQSVRLMTAHRSKGLEWPLVVVAGVQEGTWPDLRHRGSLLQSERLGPEGLNPPSSTAALLADERRLFYVACTRAGTELVITAVESPREDGDQPSRFLTELRSTAHLPIVSGGPYPRPRRPLSLRGVVAELRGLAERSASPVVRSEAAKQLAELADSGLWAARGADPARWWGIAEVTRSGEPVADPQSPLQLSGSSVSGLVSCPLSWFLAHEARGEVGVTSAQGFGLVVHALAADVVRRGAEANPADMRERLDLMWQRLEFAAPWIAERDRASAHEAIERFARWHALNSRTVLAAEHEFRTEIDMDGDKIVLRGSMDRVEVDSDGMVHVVDLKTNKVPPSSDEIKAHPQLGVYQLAVEHGAADHVAPGARSGGAELVQLRVPLGKKNPDDPKVQLQAGPPDTEPFFAWEQLQHSVRTIRQEDFVATPSVSACKFCAFKSACPARPEGAGVVGGGHT